MSEQSAQSVEKDVSSSSYYECVVVLEKELPTNLSDVERLEAHYVVNNDLVDGARTAPTLHKPASQQHVVAGAKNRDKILATKEPVETEFQKFWVDIQAKVYSIQTVLDVERKRSRALDHERVRMLISEKSYRRQVQM